MPILVPATSTKDWQDRLRDPVKQWRHGYSAKSLADHWQGERGFPADVQQMFTTSTVVGIADAEMLLGIPEASHSESATTIRPLRKCATGTPNSP